RVKLVLLLIAGEGERDYLQMLASIARLVKERDFVDELVAAPDLEELYDRLLQGVGGVVAKPVQVPKRRMNRLMFRRAEEGAKGSDCSTMLIFGDTLTAGMEAAKWFPEHRSILVTRAATEQFVDAKKIVATIQVRSFSRQRLSQLRSSVLVGLTRGLIRFTD